MAYRVDYKQVDDTIHFTPSEDIGAGQVLVVGELVGVTKVDCVADRRAALHTRGVFRFPKTGAPSGAEIAAGAVVYWDATGEVVTTDADTGTNKRVGITTDDAASADTSVEVILGR